MPSFKTLLPLILFVTGTGCASQQPAAPNPAQLQRLPLIRLGTATAAQKDYVLYVPKGQHFPIDLSIAGGPFQAAMHKVVDATLKQDMYLYKHWGSYDGKHWQALRQMLGIGLSMGMDTKHAFIKVELTKLGK